MSLPVKLGDVPAWIGAATGAAALFRGLSKRREEQAREWGDLIEELAGLDTEQLRRAFEGNPVVAEVVGLAWEEAARTGSRDKRYLLAQVAIATLRGTTTPKQVDALQLLLRTVIALDPPHITLLVLIGAGVGKEYGVPKEDLAARWPSPPDLIDPALAALEGEALVEAAEDFAGSPRGWKLRAYGRRFLDFLLVDAGGWPPAQATTQDGAT